MRVRALATTLTVCACALASLGALGCADEPEFATGGGPGNDDPSSCDDVGDVPAGVARALHLDRDFYAKHCAALGFDVLGSKRVPDAVMEEAGRIVQGVFEGQPELRDAVHDRYFRVVIVASSAGEGLDDVPELSDLNRAERSAAGIGPDPDFPAATMRDSVITCRPREQDPQATPPGDTLVHELGHAILSMGLDHTDPEFRDRLDAAYQHARSEALWTLRVPPSVEAVFPDLDTRNYLMTNPDEYWATGVSAWFGFKAIPLGYALTNERPPRLALQVLFGRDALIEHDPDLAELLDEVFGPEPVLRPTCTDWLPTFVP